MGRDGWGRRFTVQDIRYQGNDLAFDIKAVTSPDSGADLSVVIQT